MEKKKRSVLVALLVYWIRVCDRQETCIDVERNVFLDEGTFSAVDTAQRCSTANAIQISLFGDLRCENIRDVHQSRAERQKTEEKNSKDSVM